MANNLRYLLEHFCLDGQKIDISSQLDEENSNNIEKINTQTIPSINARIDEIKDTDIPNIDRRIDSIKNTDIPSINQKINTINNTTIPSVQASVTAVDEKADRINESVAKNTRDIGTLSDNVTMQGNNINELSTKVDTNTDSINAINNTSIPHLQEEIDNLSGGGSGSVGELREKVEKNTSDISELSGKVDTNTSAISTLNEKVETNTSDISALSGKVDTNTSDISALSGKVDTNTSDISNIKNRKWTKIIDKTSNGIRVEIYQAPNLPLVELHATLMFSEFTSEKTNELIVPNAFHYSPDFIYTTPVNLMHIDPSTTAYLYVKNNSKDLIVGCTMSNHISGGSGEASMIYRY